MKQIRIFVVMVIALCLILPLAAYAQPRHHSPRGEIRIVNDTRSQLTFTITTERYGTKQWTYKPQESSYAAVQGVRLRVNGEDAIEIADWGKAYLGEVAVFSDGIWQLSMRQARHAMRRQ